MSAKKEGLDGNVFSENVPIHLKDSLRGLRVGSTIIAKKVALQGLVDANEHEASKGVFADALDVSLANWYVGKNMPLDEENVTRIKVDMAENEDGGDEVFLQSVQALHMPYVHRSQESLIKSEDDVCQIMQDIQILQGESGRARVIRNVDEKVLIMTIKRAV